MRRLIAALAVTLIAASLVACGSSEAPPPATSGGTVSAAEAPPAPAAPAASAPATQNISQVSMPGTGVPFPSAPAAVPKPIVDRLKARQPMILLFFDPEQLTTDDQRSAIQTATAKYRGLIDSLEFDVTAAMPSIAPTSTLGQQVANLTRDLKIDFTPYVILVNKAGIITVRYRGYIDSGTLEREILRATQ
jgi:cell division protein FtsN